MKRLLYAVVMTTAASVPALGADVGVSIGIGQPGFYGQIDLGSAVQRPQVIYTRPIIVQRAPREVVLEPLYLRVPPGHAKNWRRYCARYDACGRPVYFVRNDWYNNVYVPRYREQHRDDRRDDREDRSDRNRRDNDNDRNDRNDRGHDNGRRGD